MQKKAKTRFKQVFPLIQVLPIDLESRSQKTREANPPNTPSLVPICGACAQSAIGHVHTLASKRHRWSPAQPSPAPNPHSDHPTRFSLTNKLIKTTKRKRRKKKKHEILCHIIFSFFCAHFIIITTNSELRGGKQNRGGGGGMVCGKLSLFLLLFFVFVFCLKFNLLGCRCLRS